MNSSWRPLSYANSVVMGIILLHLLIILLLSWNYNVLLFFPRDCYREEEEEEEEGGLQVQQVRLGLRERYQQHQAQEGLEEVSHQPWGWA
mmetsp:Transcript_13598/g.22796  ORF Transcript_13598/g.22796 Transcript_13598/m.22796 type:complete len:90 (-) Transcript_13598:2823-3092(-)